MKKRIVKIGNIPVGAGKFCVIAGPCAVESADQMTATAAGVSASGAHILRGGAFKPRTSPRDFQGLGSDGLRILREAGDLAGMPVVSEITSANMLDLFDEFVDALQVGSRNMQNFELLREIGTRRKPVILKRGMGSTVDELISASEYILEGGNSDVILCERGIRTFEPSTRATLDIGAIAVIKKRSDLPVIVDPSHAAGDASLVPALALAAVAAGADGIMIEAHNQPLAALSDGKQSLTLAQFDALMKMIGRLLPVCSGFDI